MALEAWEESGAIETLLRWGQQNSVGAPVFLYFLQMLGYASNNAVVRLHRAGFYRECVRMAMHAAE